MGRRTHPEGMAEFFDARQAGYEEHMAETVADFDRFYESIADPIPETNDALQILDVGCGTGLELHAVLSRAPNAVITGIDLSAGMLGRLRRTFVERLDQLHLIEGSYLDAPLSDSLYDFAMAVMTLHHLLPARKTELYRRIRRALKPDGAYIEGDWVVSPGEERRYLSEYHERVRGLPAADKGAYHIDVPLSMETQKSLLLDAGFSGVRVIWHAAGSMVCVARG